MFFMFEIVHDQFEHWQIIGEYQTLEEATSAFNHFVDNHQVEEEDCYVELRYYDEEIGEITKEEILVHYLTDPDTWNY